MIKTYRVDKLLKKFEIIEKKFKLDVHKINNVSWWDFSRYIIYEELLSKANLNGNQFFKRKKAKKSFIKKILNFTIKFYYFFNYLLFSKSPIWIKSHTNIIFGHPRRVFEGKLYVDKYSDPFIEIFQDKVNFALIENSLSFKHFKPAKTKNLFYGESLIFIANIISKFFYRKIPIKDKIFIKKLENSFYKNFKIKLNLLDLIKKRLPLYRAELIIYKFFFKIKKPKKVIVVNSIGYESMIEAAKSLSIVTYELQHGSPARGKLNYDYSSGLKKSSFPDFFLSFGKIFTNDIKLPISQKNIIEVGFPYLNKKLSNTLNLLKKENIFLIISQPNPISKILIDFSLNLRKKLSKDVRILYKPHPSEIFNEDTSYFKKLEENKIEVIKDYEVDLYKLLNKTKWIIGVSSTVLYEALAFNCKVFVFKAPGYERLTKLLNFDLIHLYKSTKNINELSNYNKKKKLINIFYNDNNKKIKSLF